ncbi:hypothetical protein [Halodesulfovibrio aestuarii]|uniref:Uncharacterized protein n=1 Tax=Halodesulfovibrio aestuarii TaxID=126333 RepID=A0A8G2C9V3_9BACT|nr:hypothetical protein [Halodesulfovibrio aestuarii]SHJ21703.1 hypothetical protein SAMN05660830_01831 [Halodesulfovibrio aestuarii]
MTSKQTSIDSVLKRMKKLNVGQCVDMRSFKRNRSVVIVCCGEDSFRVVEDGFYQEVWDNQNTEQVKRLLKTLLKKEFPRSNKIRLYTLDSYEDANVNRMAHGAGRYGETLPTKKVAG